ncbi:dipeptide ABC transporter ATP-binding protein [Pseudonocardia endophytica]|uniref:Peptide/nickel transport system ATP-binding protein n=1 Tax=Pseudonocardia endophytica TaxID=401976 RepID=A0A4R1HX05_PSEEN|nr:ABC transporter ATP-binding protein [Pseudonocardia endophytica]TCK22072.1 peptide/nickel transport system ATP-binding protein [Pseudonocardia endophytica]
MSTASVLLRIRDLQVGYRTARERVRAVTDVDLDVPAGRITAVVGESGSGKSTLAQSVIGLLPGSGRVESGRILLDGEDLTTLDDRGWRSVRGRRIGLVPQDPTIALDPVTPVGRQVAAVLQVHGLARGREARERAVELLDAIGLPEPARRARQYPHQLSGGMRQRVLITMATAARPGLLVADEPTSALDATVARRILDLLDHVVADTGAGILLVTHDLGVVADRATHVAVMNGGRIVEQGPTARVLGDPEHAYTRRLIADVPTATRRRRSPEPRTEAGEPARLRVRDLTRTFPVGGTLRRRHRTVVDGVAFDIAAGHTLGLVGESGSGKTTTARIVVGLERATSGSVHLGDREITGADRTTLRGLHRRIQMIYQNPYSSLNPRFTVSELLTEPMRNFGVGDRDSRPRAVRDLLDAVALPAGTDRRRAGELSGGQRQRVAIARSLSVEPEVLVCDEPVSALDVSVQTQILELLVDLQRQRGLTYLFISHDLAVVRQVSDRIAVMRDGRIVEADDTEQIFLAPRTDYTTELLAAVPGHGAPTVTDPDHRVAPPTDTDKELSWISD